MPAHPSDQHDGDPQGTEDLQTRIQLMEEEAAMQALGWTDHTRTEGEDTEETVPARASQVS